MKILFIGKRYYTNRDALTERYGRIYQLPYYWSQMGMDVQLWLVDYHTTKRSKCVEQRLKVFSSPLKTGCIIKDYLRLKKTINPDLIVASGDSYIGYLGYQLAKSLQSRFIFDVYDKYDEFPGYIRFFGFNLFAYLLKKADSRFFASSYLMQQLGVASQDHIVLNGIDELRFRNLSRTVARQHLELDREGHLIGYFGSMEPDRGVQDLVEAVEDLRKEGLAVKALIAGRSSENVDLKSEAVIYLGNLPFEKIPYALAASDVLTIPYRRSAFMDAGSSNKIAEAIACQRPIVATESPNLTKNYPKQANSLKPFMARPGEPKDLARAIKKQLEQRFLVDPLENIYWSEIAKDALKHLERIHASNA